MKFRRPLTPRQQEVLHLLEAGLGDKEISQILGISPRGAKYLVSQILIKAGVHSRKAFLSRADFLRRMQPK